VAQVELYAKVRCLGLSDNHDRLDDFAVVQGASKLSDLKKESVPRRILVVDDNETARISIAILLEVMGHTVTTASSGVKAIQCVANFRPEVVLLDLMMPGMSGYETARRIREQTATQSITLIAVTGWVPEDGDSETAKVFDYYLLKPIDAGALEKVLKAQS
jgi:CheY-like chemotaxis protein